MKVWWIFLLALLLNLGAFARSHAQFSWKPKPYPECKSFAVTDFQVLVRLTAPPYEQGRFYHFDTLETSWTRSLRGKLSFISDLGLMWNLNKRYAVGFSHILVGNFGSDEDGFYGGFKLRLRKWLTEKSSMEVSPGILLWGNNIGGLFKRPGWAASLDYRWKESMGVSLHAEYLRGNEWDYTGGESGEKGYADSDLGIYLGARTGSVPGLIANAAGLAGLGAVILFFVLFFPAD